MTSKAIRAVNAWSDDAGTVTYFERAGSLVRRRISAGHCASFVRVADATPDVQRAIRASRFVSGVSSEGEYLRLTWRSKRVRDAACANDGWFATNEVSTFEADVSPVQRWIVDAKVAIQRPRVAMLDIETCARFPMSQKERHRILCWCIIDAENGDEVSGVLAEDTDASEAALLAQLWAALESFDLVTAWNGDGFDFPVVFARSKLAKINVDARRWLWLDHMEVFRRMNTASESGDEKQSMALQAIATAVLGEGKIPGFGPREMFEAWRTRTDELLAYNVHDVRLMRKIEQRTGFIDLLFTLCEATGVFPDTRGIRPMPQVETYVMRLASEQGLRFATRQRFDESEMPGAFRGAFVMEPKGRGVIRERVHVCDFSAMYPSIIQSWNMSSETVVAKPEMEIRPGYLSHLPLPPPPPRPEHCAEAPGTMAWFDMRRRGILPRVLDTLGQLRGEWNAKKAAAVPGSREWIDADRKSTAYKVANNSCFGVASSPMSRLYSREVGESITLTGVHLIKQVVGAAERERLRVVYGDTDSAFVSGCDDERFRQLVATWNESIFPGVVHSSGGGECKVKLAYEKAFECLLFVSAKRYIGRLAHYKGTMADERTKPEIKGLEWRRGDTCKLARQLQAVVIDMLLGGGVVRPRVTLEECETDPAAFVRLIEQWREMVLHAELELEDVVLAKRLTRPLRDYSGKKKIDGSDAAQPPHVRVAKVLAKRGESMGEGARVAYFVMDGAAKPATVLPAMDWVGECDRFALWEDLVWPATERLLSAAFPDRNWAPFGRVRPSRRGAPQGAPAPTGKGKGRGRLGDAAAGQQGALFALGEAVAPRVIGRA